MGVVAAATHLALGQIVALKFMLPAAMRYPENVARFEREARAAVRLKSDHVARVSDVGHLPDGAPYIVMEYLEGEDLDTLIERGTKLSVETAVDYVLQACEAVAEAHSLGIVHRDLKPKNLFLTKRLSGKPLVKVLDFGISKSTKDSDLSLTSTTQHLGSPNYMSPEQLRSARDVDQRTDLWSLGVILHELLTGQVPFVADTVTQLTAKVLEEPPVPTHEARSDVPPGLSAAIAKCLEKKPEHRFQSVHELTQAIAPFASADGAQKATEILAPISGGRTSTERIASPEPISFRVVKEGSSTNSAWDRTQLAPSTRGKRPFIFGGAIVAVAIAGTIGFALTRHKHPDATPEQSKPTPVTSAPAPSVETPEFKVAATAPAAGTTSAPKPTVAPLHPTIRTKPDGGTISVAPVDAGSVAPPTTFQLPNVRN